MKIETQLKQGIAKATGLDFDAVKLERPADESHGEWSTNIALVLSKKLGRNPRELAEEIKTKLEQEAEADDYPEANDYLEAVEVAGPGFINFRIKKEYYLHLLERIDSKFGKGEQKEEKQRIMMEYGHPNTHKLPHIGHMFSYFVGDSLARILAFAGNDVYKVNYQGDIGPHVAKCIYGWRELGRQEPVELVAKVRHLQECYQHGAKLYEDSEQHAEKIRELNKAIYQGEPEARADWEKTRQWSLDFYLQLESRIGVKQSEHYLESQMWERGLEVVKENLGKVFEQSDGAVIFAGEKQGLHNRVFITQKGTATYETKEVALAIKKMEDWEFDLTITPTASEQNGYFKVVIKAIEQCRPELEGKLEHIGFGMVQLKGMGKMSSRTGKIVSGIDLLDMVKERMTNVVSKREGLSAEHKEEVAEKVTLGAIKYAFLRGNVMQNTQFDLEESISFEGNSGPYLQYTYARIQSVLRYKPEIPAGTDRQMSAEAYELPILKWLDRFPETVAQAAKTRSPHLIAGFAYELAQRFNSFYREHSINSAKTPKVIAFRRELAEKTAQTIRASLVLLGIETVEQM
ncbi:MAG: arginine--tRNA ligase [Candidatus Dojkabacteria bacterium]